jgi:hypothetical protein
MNDLPYEIIELILTHAGFYTCIEIGWHNLADKIYNEELHGWEVACTNGNLAVIKWLYKYDKRYNDFQGDNLGRAVYVAIKYGHVEILKYLNTIGLECDEDMTDNAIYNGQIEILIYLKSLGLECYEYSECLECIQYGMMCYECSEDISPTGYKKYEIGKTYVIDTAAWRGHIDMFKYLYESGMDFQDRTLYDAAKYGHIEIVKYICEMADITGRINMAATYGYVDVLKLIYINDKYSIPNAMIVAAEGGHIDVVKYLFKLFKQSTAETIEIAEENEQIDIVEYIDEFIDEISLFTINAAEHNEQHEIVSYISLFDDDVDNWTDTSESSLDDDSE